MTMRATIVACVIAWALLPACKKDGDGAGGKPGDKDWSQVALEPFDGTVDGIDFSVQIPQGMKIREQQDIRIEWEAAEGDEFKSPHVTVSRTFTIPKSPSDAVADVMPGPKDAVVKQEAIDGGFVVVWHTPKKGLVRAAVYRIRGEDEGLTCRATLANDDGIPNFDGTMAWLEKICQSLTLK